MRLRRISAANRKASFSNRKASSENWKVFFRNRGRLLPNIAGFINTCFWNMVQLCLPYLLRLNLGLPCLHSGLPHLRLSRNSGLATEGFPNCGINFKDAYHMYMCAHSLVPRCPPPHFLLPIYTPSNKHCGWRTGNEAMCTFTIV